MLYTFDTLYKHVNIVSMLNQLCVMIMQSSIDKIQIDVRILMTRLFSNFKILHSPPFITRFLPPLHHPHKAKQQFKIEEKKI